MGPQKGFGSEKGLGPEKGLSLDITDNAPARLWFKQRP